MIIPLLAAFLALPWIFSSIVMMDPPLRTDALFWSGAALVAIGVAYMGLNLPCGRNLAMESKAVPVVLSSAAIPRFGPPDDLLGVV